VNIAHIVPDCRILPSSGGASVGEISASVGEILASVGEILASVGEIVASVGERLASVGVILECSLLEVHVFPRIAVGVFACSNKGSAFLVFGTGN
jgi:hypothetical protein